MEKSLALSPLDGRYATHLTDLSALFSEFALTKNRVLVEVEYLLFLAKKKLIPRFSVAQSQQLRLLVARFSFVEFDAIKIIEQKTHHDVKAVEYFLRDYLLANNIPNSESVHLCLTSEDTNAIAYGLALKEAKEGVLVPELSGLLRLLGDYMQEFATTPMLARTHGQPAVPTTVGKEFGVFAERLLVELQILQSLEVEAKLTGAVGNLNAHAVTFPDESMLSFSKEFVSSFGLKPNMVTTQILPAESFTRIFSSLIRVNCILLDLSQDFWRYCSEGYLGVRIEKSQVGSSTMPQKINPINFENAEGNLGVANALLIHLVQKLPVSRLQRDLSDSTVKRNIGVALGHCLLSYQALRTGLTSLTINTATLEADLENHWEILAEAYQVILRKNGVKDGYEFVKELTQGKQLTDAQARAWIGELSLKREIKQELASVTPQNYIGSAPAICALVSSNITNFFQGKDS